MPILTGKEKMKKTKKGPKKKMSREDLLRKLMAARAEIRKLRSTGTKPYDK